MLRPFRSRGHAAAMAQKSSLFQDLPRAHFQISPEPRAADTPAKATLVACARGRGGTCLFPYWLQQQQKNQKNLQDRNTFFFLNFSFRRVRKKVKALQKCHIKKPSVLEKVLWSSASCWACVTVAGHSWGQGLAAAF